MTAPSPRRRRPLPAAGGAAPRPASAGSPALEAWLVAGIVAALYFLTASGNLHKHPMAHFDWLADAFLNGRLDLASPASTVDLTRFQGRWYVPFPPLPALLMLPIVALLGADAPFEVPFSILLGAATVTCFFLLLHATNARGWTRLDRSAIRWLTALFAFGTAQWYVSCSGTVWFLSHVATGLFLTLAVLLAARRAPPLLCGAALALATWARPHVFLALPLLAAELASRAPGGARPRARDWIALLLPVGLGLGALLAYNAARFANPLDFGYLAQNVDAALTRDLATFGQFHPHYLSRNFFWEFLSPPQLDGRFPFFTPDPRGMSVLLVTPAFFYLFRRLPSELWQRGALAALILLNLLLLFYYNTGWFQFGYRFSLDYTLFALILIAGTVDGKPSRLLKWLIVASILVNLRGTWWWFTR